MGAHECDGIMCMSPDHRSAETYRIGGLADDLAARQIVARYLQEQLGGDGEDANFRAAGLLARLAGAEPPLLTCRLYEVDPAEPKQQVEREADPPAHLDASPTNDRGFDGYPPIKGAYGGHTDVRESSSAEGPHLWISLSEPVDLNAAARGDDSAGLTEATLHMTAEAAWQFSEQIRHALEHHYQGDARPHDRHGA